MQSLGIGEAKGVEGLAVDDALVVVTSGLHGGGVGGCEEFGKVELCNFSATLKREIFPRLRDAMEGGRLRIPRDESLRVDLAAMQQVVTAGGFSYEAPRTREGHSDRCTAAALCVRAGSSPESCAHVGVLPAVRPGERRSRGGNSGVMANWKERLMSWVRR